MFFAISLTYITHDHTQLSANVIIISVSKNRVKLTETDCINCDLNARIFPGAEMLKKFKNHLFYLVYIVLK